jgi:hypothetical protein
VDFRLRARTKWTTCGCGRERLVGSSASPQHLHFDVKVILALVAVLVSQKRNLVQKTVSKRSVWCPALLGLPIERLRPSV